MLKVAYIRKDEPAEQPPPPHERLTKKQQREKDVQDLSDMLVAKWRARNKAKAEKKYGVKLP